MSGSVDWIAWHERYRDPASGPSQRLPVVQRFIWSALDEGNGELRAVSMCAGDCRDLLGVLAEHPRGACVRARLVELEPRLAGTARATVPSTLWAASRSCAPTPD